MFTSSYNYSLIIPALAHSLFVTYGMSLPEFNSKSLEYTYTASGFFGKRSIRRRVEKTLKEAILRPIREKDTVFLYYLKSRVRLAMSAIYGIGYTGQDIERNINDEFLDTLKAGIKYEIKRYVEEHFS